MIHNKFRYLLTLVALFAMTAGAWADEVKYPIVFDFEAAANAGENPANKNGSTANGQQFYGWENAEKTDWPRQDYKGYEYAEGSKLPEVCHVWRRSDRFPDNVAGKGGLYCPSNKEMAVDGLTEGLAVTIIYDATNATNKEIVWAIGDGSSSQLTQPRATATINGVEAVPGQTTIKSGDMIIVNSVTKAENGSGYIVFKVMKDMVIKKIIIDVAPAGNAVPLTWDATAKTATLTNGMPAGNVTVSVDYYPQATADGAVTAATDAKATTDAPLVTVDATMLTGATKLMYYVSTEATAPAYDAEGWTDVLPTAEKYTEAANLNVWYYPVGTDDGVGGATATYSDGDMNATALTVTLGDAPTYNVTFAEGVNPEPPAEPEWTATPNTGVKKGQTVTVTYSGTRKVIGVKAEKKAEAKEVLTYSFDDASHPSGLTAGSRVSFDYSRTSVITNSKFLNAYNNANGDPNATTVSLGDTDLSGETWTLSFEWAACGGCNSKPDHTTLKAGDATLFDLNGNSNWNTTVTIIYTGSDGSKTLPVPGCDKSNRFTEAVGDQYNTTTYWHHIVVTGSAEGVKMTITNSSTGAAVVEDVVLSETNVNPTSLIIEPSCGGGIGIDALSLTYEE